MSQWIEMGLNPIAGVLTGPCEDISHKKRELPVTTETDLAVMLLQAREHQGLLTTAEAQREPRKRAIRGFFQKEPTCQYLDFGLLGSKTKRESISDA
jgi:hypothetical protein